jgi:hypothetical protein
MAGSSHLSLRTILIGLTAVLALLLAAPAAQAEEDAGGGRGCPGDVLERPFAPWNDTAWYTLAPDGDLTNGGAGWDLDGAELVDDNEPWYVHGGDTPAALRLSSGDSATTPPICVTLLHPTMRFFARSAGGALGTMTVEVLFGNGQSLPIGVLIGLLQGDEWGPSLPTPIVANLFNDEVRFRFTAIGANSAWVIDDVYVDPYGKG